MDVVLSARQTWILQRLVEEYIETAEPVASTHLADAFNEPISSATIRNELAHLEQLGLIRQPHTSAGRVPTELGYQIYLTLERKTSRPLPQKDRQRLEEQVSPRALQSTEAVRALARCLNELSGEMVVAACDPEWGYHTGLSDLFDKPEFQSRSDTKQLLQVIDEFDATLEKLFARHVADLEVLIGSRNPLGKEMTTIVVRYQTPDGRPGLLALIGPLRMNYHRNVKLMEQVRLLLGGDPHDS